MRTSSRLASDALTNTTVVGSIILLVALVGVYISYNSNKGLPFVPSYVISIDVPDSAELVEAASEVRIGGARVGLVQEVKAVRGRGNNPSFARIKVALNPEHEPLPVDTTAQVRPRSILGSKYVDLVPGESKKGIAAGGTLPLENALAIVELDEAFNLFDEETTQGLRHGVTALGDGLAGRGTSLNLAFESISDLMAPLQRVTRTIAAEGTQFERFITGAAATSRAFGAEAASLGRLFDSAATTFDALNAAGSEFEETLVELPPTEEVGTRTLTRITPVLADAAAIMRAIRPGTHLLPATLPILADAVEVGTPVLRRLNAPIPGSTKTLAAVTVSLGVALTDLAEDPATQPAVKSLTVTVSSLDRVLDTLLPAQQTCNVIGLYNRNVSSTISAGDPAGNWLPLHGIMDLPQMLGPSGFQDPKLHANPIPHMDATECEAGNEPYPGTVNIGNPPGKQPAQTENTSPPASAANGIARARAKGLFDNGGAR